jgi:hypothetical protein
MMLFMKAPTLIVLTATREPSSAAECALASQMPDYVSDDNSAPLMRVPLT